MSKDLQNPVEVFLFKTKKSTEQSNNISFVQLKKFKKNLETWINSKKKKKYHSWHTHLEAVHVLKKYKINTCMAVSMCSERKSKTVSMKWIYDICACLSMSNNLSG